jgi:hypothetical protein
MFTPRGEHYCFEEWRGKQRISPAEDNFTPREPIHPWGQNLSLGAKLRIGLWFSFRHVQLVPHLLETVLVSIQACSAGSCLFVFRHVQLVLVCLFSGMFSWFPIFFPLRTPIQCVEGSRVEVHFWRINNAKNVIVIETRISRLIHRVYSTFLHVHGNPLTM